MLGLTAPWTVARVELDVGKQRVDVWTEHASGVLFACSECGAELAVYDHAEERAWRHLDSCQFLTYLHARPPRVKCPRHGVRQASLPWAEARSRFTLMFERLAVELLGAASVSGAARVLRLSWDEAWYLMHRAVKRGLAAKAQRVVKRIGVDEKAVGAGHDYVTVVCDIERGTVEDLQEGRKTASLLAFYDKLSPAQLAGIEAVAMDMHHGYLGATLERVPDAKGKIVHDLFHVMRDMGKAVDDVRRVENAQLKRQGDATLERSRFLWLYGEERIPERSRARFEALKAADLRTARAWALKENLRQLWRCPTADEAYEHFDRWYQWAVRSKLNPVITVAKRLNRHLRGLMSYFTHRITNAVSEGLNGKIQAIKKMAYGFRNRANFKTAVFFHCGGLDLLPPRTH